LNDVILLII